MLGTVTPFLDALGLNEQADERAVRRAYAQRLKLIDQAADPQAFQSLREDYEKALRWVAWQARQRAESQDTPIVAEQRTLQAPTVEPAPPPPTPTAPENRPAEDSLPEPHRAGNEVFGRFVARAEAGDGFPDEAAARDALADALTDDRLVNLEARTFFEWRVASLLMNGWRPGHEFLFGPACESFHWEQDRRHLTLFGPLGAAVDAAIAEKLIFFRQSPMHFDVQRKLIRRLRQPGLPSERMLVEKAPILRMLVQRYPRWLHIITSRDNVQQWLEAYEALPAATRARREESEASASAPSPAGTGDGLGSKPASKRSPFGMIGLIGFIMFVLSSLSHLSSQGGGRSGTAIEQTTTPAIESFPSKEMLDRRAEQLRLLPERQQQIESEMKKALVESHRSAR
jgi:protein TonB